MLLLLLLAKFERAVFSSGTAVFPSFTEPLTILRAEPQVWSTTYVGSSLRAPAG